MKAIGEFISGVLGVLTLFVAIITFIITAIFAVVVGLAGLIVAIPFVLLNVVIRAIFRLDKKKTLNLEKIQNELNKAGLGVVRTKK